MMIKIIKGGVLWLALAILSSCHIYSFTGASISPDLKSVSVRLFENNAPLVVPVLAQSITEALKDKIINSTTLDLRNTNADAVFEGQVTDYSINPISVQANEAASQNRITITVKVKYSDIKNEKNNWESSFSRYADFSSSQSLSAVESDLIKQINSQLVEDIFNKAYVNW